MVRRLVVARLSFSSASRFTRNFICEDFLNTFASPAEELRHPLVGHAAGAQARRVRTL